jgi:hypothetical protein
LNAALDQGTSLAFEERYVGDEAEGNEVEKRVRGDRVGFLG